MYVCGEPQFVYRDISQEKRVPSADIALSLGQRQWALLRIREERAEDTLNLQLVSGSLAKVQRAGNVPQAQP